jgi:hypothetical protein
MSYVRLIVRLTRKYVWIGLVLFQNRRHYSHARREKLYGKGKTRSETDPLELSGTTPPDLCFSPSDRLAGDGIECRLLTSGGMSIDLETDY